MIIVHRRESDGGLFVSARNSACVVPAGNLIANPSYPWAAFVLNNRGEFHDIAEGDLRTVYQLACTWARQVQP